MAHKPKPHPHPIHSGDVPDMPWLDPSRLPKKQPNSVGTIAHAVDAIQAIIRSLPTRHDRHQALAYALARLLESEHIKGLNEVWQRAMQESNRYSHIPD